MVKRKSILYDRIVELSQEYLGPAGERFMRRQISTHIGIEPEAIRKKHLPELVNWVGLTFAMLTNNRNEVDNFTDGLMALQDAE